MKTFIAAFSLLLTFTDTVVQAHLRTLTHTRNAVEAGTTLEIELFDGVPSHTYNVSMDESMTFYMDVENFSIVKCETKGNDGALDLFMTFNDPNATGCMSGGVGTSSQQCSLPGHGRVYAVVYGYMFTTDFTVTCSASETSITKLASGVKAGPYVLQPNAIQYFYLNASTPALITCEIEDSDDIMNLYMRSSISSEFVCGSEGISLIKNCYVGPEAGFAVIEVQGMSSAIQFSLNCTALAYIAVPVENVELESGVRAGPYNLLMDETLQLFMHVSVLSFVTCETDEPNGSLELHLYWENHPGNYCFSAGSCFLGPDEGIVKIELYSYPATIGFSITCTAHAASPTKMESGVATSSFNVGAGEIISFLLDVPAPSTVDCVVDGNGNADLHLHLYAGSAGYGCSLNGTTPMSSKCSFKAGAGELYVSVLGKMKASDISITCTSNMVTVVQLMDNVPSGPHNAAVDEYLYFSFPTSVESNVTCETTADNGDLDLLMNKDGSDQYDCTSASYSSIESCSVWSHSGAVYAITYGFNATKNFNITCTISP